MSAPQSFEKCCSIRESTAIIADALSQLRVWHLQEIPPGSQLMKKNPGRFDERLTPRTAAPVPSRSEHRSGRCTN